MLIGLTGAAGAGKDTVASMIDGAHVTAFAQPLYECLSTITGIPVARLRDREVKEATIPWLGRSPRQMLQTLGTEWGRNTVCEDIWVRSLLERVAPRLTAGETVVITDVRFDNEAAAVVDAGGEVWRVVRPGWRCLSGDSAAHPSEAGVSDYLVAMTLVNDGTVDDLRLAIARGRMKV